ncbi:Lytic transglycosylase catalytic [Gemmatirosa kalamazoonensis]|uniref:Lytic transglycosylase catalytic n=1 Tax=Gemmatirosa kalamazoonensis TaxID=861299 RepID=W0RLL4_9BACT|nr:lytic transglycosylase domain-containing protein [Gemmatirosa kalamazoonensis]AHG91337.1 Lytic transglycosylase catalytic [Gemmatirosa kalamazoonensis]
MAPLRAALVTRRRPAPLLGALLAATTACATAPHPVTAPTPAPTVRQADAGETFAGATPPTSDAKRAARPARAARNKAATDSVVPSHVHAPGVTFDLPVHDFESDERVRRYVSLFSGRDREDFTAQLERGTRYETMIRAKLRAAGVPEDMRYLALIESGYDPQATSRVQAVGMWQFMLGTARDVGLRVDWWVDERRDPVRSTDAAARNLRWLRSHFGSPFLAAAAYNGGETRVAKGLAQLAMDDSLRVSAARLDSMSQAIIAEMPNDTADAAEASTAVLQAPDDSAPIAPAPAEARSSADARFFALSSAGYLRSETKNYVPQLIAATLVAKEPARYGITVRSLPAYAYDSVRVPALTPLAAVASAADVSRAQLLELNPHLLRGLTPPGASTVVRVPVGRAAATARALDELPASERRAFRRLTTKKRESFDALSDRAGVPAAALLRRYNPGLDVVTHGKWKGRLVSGQPVRVPTRAVLDFSRDVPSYDDAPIAGLPMPAAPATRDTVAHVAHAAHAASGKKRDSTDDASAASPRKSTDRARAVATKAAKTAKAKEPNATGKKATPSKASPSKGSPSKASKSNPSKSNSSKSSTSKAGKA